MLCALLQFGSLVSAVNRPSPPTARTRRSEPRTALSKRFSSQSSSIRSCAGDDDERRAHHVEPEDRPEFLGQPHQMLHRRGRVQRQHVADHRLVRRMRDRTQFVGGRHCRSISCRADTPTPSLPGQTRSVCERSDEQSILVSPRHGLLRFARNDDAARSSTKSLSTPFDQFGADLIRLFLLRPMAAVRAPDISPDRE